MSDYSTRGKQDTLIQALRNGWTDRVRYGLLRIEQLYRRPVTRKIAWRLGWEVANLLTDAPLRTEPRT